MYIYRVVLHVSKVKRILSFIILILNEKKLQSSYEVTFFYREMTRAIIENAF